MSKLRARMRVPNPAMIVAIVALIAAFGGSAYAGSKIGFGELSKKAKKQTAGAGPLVYVSTPNVVPTTGANPLGVAAYCPGGMEPIGGGIRLSSKTQMIVTSDHPVTDGWAGTVHNDSAFNRSAIVTVICANSRSVDGILPSTS